MVNAEVKEGNVKKTISIPEEMDKAIKGHCKKQGDYSNYIIDAVKEKLQREQAPCQHV
jgi:hypothetical protein